jgi:hypothetical protein
VRLPHLLAQVAANEGAFENRRELDLVWQTVEGRVPGARRGWLRQHSARVAGLKPCAGGNCRWSRFVCADGSLPAAVQALVGMAPGWWEAVRAPVMRTLLARARFLVAGGAYERPCAEQPITWGRQRDHGYAVRRGLVRLWCTGTINDGYAMAREVRR